MLADLGADVIKVIAMHDGFWAGTHMGLGTNRGKRSIALNLKDPRGCEALNRLIATADVVAVNWRPGAAARLGLDYDSLPPGTRASCSATRGGTRRVHAPTSPARTRPPPR